MIDNAMAVTSARNMISPVPKAVGERFDSDRMRPAARLPTSL